MNTVTRKVRHWSLALAVGGLVSPLAGAMTTEQCNQKLSNTLLDRAATTTELANPDPMGRVDGLLNNSDFKEYFARFVNAHMNWGPKDNADENPVYMSLINYVFKNDLQWKELLVHDREIVGQNANPSTKDVGYFNHRNWRQRYEGNEEDGFKLRTAYMIMNNMIGLNLEAVTVSATGASDRDARKTPGTVCYHCHYRFDFALDRVADILPRVNRENMDVQNRQDLNPLGSMAEVFGTTITTQGASDPKVAGLRNFVEMLAERDEFYSNACNIAFEFTFGREADGSDPDVFDGCVAEFRKTGKILDAVRHFIESPIFCQDLEG